MRLSRLPKPPKKRCEDKKCPFHGRVSIRKQMIEGTVVSAKMQRTVIVLREYVHYVPKYMRYERRRSRIPAHNPPCINAKVGDRVRVASCRPLSKTVKFVVVERLG